MKLQEMEEPGTQPVLLINEVGMVSSILLDLMSLTLQVAIGSDKYLGGVPVVLFGDFGQLAPINKQSDQIDWLWDSSQLYRCFIRYDLQEYVRHNGNDVFSTFLRNLRSWSLTGDTQVNKNVVDGLMPGIRRPNNAVRLCTHRFQFYKINK